MQTNFKIIIPCVVKRWRQLIIFSSIVRWLPWCETTFLIDVCFLVFFRFLGRLDWSLEDGFVSWLQLGSLEAYSFCNLWMPLEGKEWEISQGPASSIHVILDVLFLKIDQWVVCHKEFSNLSLFDILRNWDACMSCWPFISKSIVSQRPLKFGVLKFNVDGAARGK